MEEKFIKYPNVKEGKYKINEYGEVFDVEREKVINQRSDKDGYLVINLTTEDKRQQTFKVHRLVAHEFCKNNAVELKTQVNHKDENKFNNHYSNLEWVTHAYNINYGMRTEKAIKHREKPIILKNVNTGDVLKLNSIAAACRILELDERRINEVLKGQRKTTNGYCIWYAESPVYDVIPVPIEKIRANEYNPNSVAPAEMKLLYDSIEEDKYTMPIVCYYHEDDDMYEIVDGFHRYTIMLKYKDIYEREHGVLPVTVIDKEIDDRMASTIRHNRARGSHDVDLMSNIVAELHEMGRTDTWIAKHLGMDLDEILRLKQITGLAALFKDKEFSKSWTTEV